MIGNNIDARFDVTAYYRDGRDPQHHVNVSAETADDLEYAFETDSGVSQVTVTQRETATDAAPHGDPTDEVIKLTADAVLLGDFHDGRHVLLIERGGNPFKGHWALPGGHVDQGEETEDAARRELAEEAGITISNMTYVGAYAAVGRDPRGRYVSFAYAWRMPHRIEPVAGDDATRAAWVRVDDVLSGAVPVAFDHGQVIRDALAVTPLYHS